MNRLISKDKVGSPHAIILTIHNLAEHLGRYNYLTGKLSFFSCKRREKMSRIRLIAITLVISMLGLFLVFPATSKAEKKLYIGGSFALTGPYAENCASVLAAFEDYAQYVNETKRMAPWRNEKFPADITLEVLWRDDMLQPTKAISIYEELKAKGILVFQLSGSPQAMALKDRLNDDHVGTVTMATGSYLLKPPLTIFTNAPIYTDSLAAIADWFKENWKEARNPRVAYLTADNAMGKSIVIPEMEAYLKKTGYEFVGIQYVPLVPVTPPTTQLMWLKQNKVDLALGMMICPGTEPTIKEAVRLGMGPNLEYKIMFGFGGTCPASMFERDMGKLADGVLIGGSNPLFSQDLPGVKFAVEIQKRRHPDKFVNDGTYFTGLLEVMTQVEALRLALETFPVEKLTPQIVLEHGFYRIKNFEAGGLPDSPLTYEGPNKVEGVGAAGVFQFQGAKAVRLGTWPLRHLY
jgi:branched-chain amino acid transport system substrate-binding protein